MTGGPPRSGDMKRADGSTFRTAEFWSNIQSPFAELRTVSETQIIELKSIYGISKLRDATTTAGSGTVSHNGPEFKLSTTASGTDSATLDSAEFMRYVPGFAVGGGIGVRRPTAPTGDQEILWGMFDDNNGFAFGEDSSGLFVRRRSGGTDNDTRRADWNGDKLDGSGPSGLKFDPTDGHIYRIEFTWYGYGPIHYQVLVTDDDNRLRQITVHRENPTGTVSVENPNLPIRAAVDNGGTATALDLFVGGRQAHVIGGYSPNRRITSERRLELGSIGTTFLPTVSFRRKSNISNGAFFEAVSVKVASFDLITDADLVWQLRTGVSLTDASFGTPTDHTAAETALEADTSATAVSGGEVLDSGLFLSGQGNQAGGGEQELPNLDFIGTDVVSLLVRRVSGTGATVSTTLRCREEW